MTFMAKAILLITVMQTLILGIFIGGVVAQVVTDPDMPTLNVLVAGCGCMTLMVLSGVLWTVTIDLIRVRR